MSIRTVKTGNEESIMNKIAIEMGFYQNYSLKLLEDVFSRAVVDELVPDLADDVLDNTDVDGARRSRHFRFSLEDSSQPPMNSPSGRHRSEDDENSRENETKKLSRTRKSSRREVKSRNWTEKVGEGPRV